MMEDVTAALGEETMLFIRALGATAVVGLFPIVLLAMVPRKLSRDKGFLKVLLGFSLGGLTGDALLHLLPHSVGHSHHHHHDHHGHDLQDLKPWLWTLCGVLLFFLMDKAVRNRLHAHQTSAHNASSAKQDKKRKEVQKKGKEAPDDNGRRQLAPSGFLNLIADFFHNFTDGLAIGASFRTGHGLQTTIAILLHEVPHEIGDYAVLVDSGFSKTEAIGAQVVTATGAMAGTFVGLLWWQTVGSDAWITPVTAGGFLYIGLATIIPTLLEDSSLKQTVLEVLGMFVGVYSMVFIALYME